MKKIFFIHLVFLISLFSIHVYAETGFTTDKTGISFRSQPSTAKSEYVITTIPYGTEFYISEMYAATGGGCSKGWHRAYYGGSYGYVCSGLVKIVGQTDTSYDRPWTSPKKAIVGGAKFISNGYISKGQNTAYLKKFNVNPNSFYSVFTNQYMANLRAPASEANTTFKSLQKNNLLNNPYNFLIPVYNNMPEQNYSYSGLYQVQLNTSDVIDSSFEESIQSFPDSYKPYLRYIHTIHPNWTFTVLNTGLDFNDAFVNIKYNSSIEVSSGYCEQSPYYVTETGWCIANDDATKFFIDPRNFLSEKYVFMFENLSNSDLYTENVIQSVLSDTFMNGMSLLDNQSYSSIFIEAGNTAKVSSLYLASLARQEAGTTISNTTNGDEFTYQGYTYSGLYNFFNIGASSGEDNPALAGLVYANGGIGANGAKKTSETEISGSDIVNTDFLSLLGISKNGDYINGYELGTTIKTIKNNVGNNANVVVTNSNGDVVSDDAVIGTGYTISLNNTGGSASYIYVMYGDLNSDTEIDSADLLSMRLHLLSKNVLINSNYYSADINKDGVVDSADLLIMRQYLLGKNSIEQ